MKITVEIAQEYSKWDDFPELNTDYFAENAKAVLARYPNLAQIEEYELSVLLTDDAKMQSLNSEFRGRDKATNVLSFPDMELNWRLIVEFHPDSNYIYLGDMAFGFETIAKEAAEKDISFQDHFRHLLIHSLLHLIGYDHQDGEESEAMEEIEIEILRGFGVKSPY